MQLLSSGLSSGSKTEKASQDILKQISVFLSS